VFILAALLIDTRRRAGLPLTAFAACTALWFVPLLVAIDGNFGALGGFVGAVNQAGLFSGPEPTLVVPLLCFGAGLQFKHDRTIRWLLLSGSALFLTQYPRMDTL